MSTNIPSHRISFTEEQIKEILESTEGILRSGNVILGDYTKQFEQEYAEACGRRYGVAVSSDTAAFEMQLKTLAGPVGHLGGAHVLYPALAFPSILEAVYNAGGKPWFFDGDWDGHLFARLNTVQEAAEASRAETGRWPAAIILMHTAGLIARDSVEITQWCESVGIAVLEDAAHSFGATLDGRKAGSFGLSSAFSLYATKPMHACEGGIIVTDDETLANECKLYRNYGRGQDFGRSVIIRRGYSWRMTEIQAVIGLSNLRNIEPNLERRQDIMMAYDDMVLNNRDSGGVWGNIGDLELSPGMNPNGYRYVKLLPQGFNGRDRLVWKQKLQAATGVVLPGEVYELPTHKQPIFVGELDRLSFPMAEEFCDRHFALPVYQTLSDRDVKHVFDSVTKSLEEIL